MGEALSKSMSTLTSHQLLELQVTAYKAEVSVTDRHLKALASQLSYDPHQHDTVMSIYSAIPDGKQAYLNVLAEAGIPA